MNHHGGDRRGRLREIILLISGVALLPFALQQDQLLRGRTGSLDDGGDVTVGWYWLSPSMTS